MFLATDGIYEFDGNRSKKISFDFDNMLVSDHNNFSVAEYFNGYYYLACVLDFEDEVYGCEQFKMAGNNALIKIDVNNDYYCEILRGCDIKSFTNINDGLNNCLLVSYFFDSTRTEQGLLDTSGMIQDRNIKKYWKSEMCDFDMPDKYKFIKEMSFTSKTDIEVNIYLDNKIKTYKVSGRNESQTIKINEKAKLLGIEFVSNLSGTYITVPQVKVGFYE